MTPGSTIAVLESELILMMRSSQREQSNIRASPIACPASDDPEPAAKSERDILPQVQPPNANHPEYAEVQRPAVRFDRWMHLYYTNACCQIKPNIAKERLFQLLNEIC